MTASLNRVQTASNEAKDSAFVSALAQQCEVNYLAIGSLK
jgi:hypothetical protein